MSYRGIVACLALGLICVSGCARTARSTAGFAVENSVTVSAPFEETWQIVKSVLREQGYDLYTRDTRGHFVAYTEQKRDLGLLTPRRMKYTVDLAKASEGETLVRVDAVRQVYGVTLLTYPGWHDRKMKDASGVEAILQAVQAKVGAK